MNKKLRPNGKIFIPYEHSGHIIYEIYENITRIANQEVVFDENLSSEEKDALAEGHRDFCTVYLDYMRRKLQKDDLYLGSKYHIIYLSDDGREPA